MVFGAMAHPAGGAGGKEPEYVDKVNIGFGLVRVREYADVERLSLFWGLLRATSKRKDVEGAAAKPSADASVPAVDPYAAALKRVDKRMEPLRNAGVNGCLSVAFFYLASLSAAKPGWAAAWYVAGVITLATSAGSLLSVFGEGFRARFTRREFEKIHTERDTRRVEAGQQTHALQELTASIAHEIRNPITAAKSLVQQMGEDPSAHDNVEFARVALEELERVERSVSHLLRFARDEEVELEELLLADVVRSATAAMQDRAADTGIVVVLELDSEGPIAGDADKLRRVFLNLIGNALDAISEEAIADGRIRIQMGEDLAGEEVWVRVRDNGPGLAADRLPKIFSPFHTSKDSGTGLGLPITKKIVEAHGGTIDAASSEGKGAEFVLTFPKHDRRTR